MILTIRPTTRYWISTTWPQAGRIAIEVPDKEFSWYLMSGASPNTVKIPVNGYQNLKYLH